MMHSNNEIEELAMQHGAIKQFGYRNTLFYCMTKEELMAFADAINKLPTPIQELDDND